MKFLNAVKPNGPSPVKSNTHLAKAIPVIDNNKQKEDKIFSCNSSSLKLSLLTSPVEQNDSSEEYSN